MKAHLKELQTKLLGHILDDPQVREYFSTDTSVLREVPEAVIYPLNTADVRKTVLWAAARAAAGKPIGLIGRGRGSNQSGAAIGSGLQLVFPAHMNRLLKIDKETVTVQPGMLYDTLQQILHSHGRFLPPYPASSRYCTVGGAVANNSSGEKSVKYGSTRSYIESLKVVLSDGSLIETRRQNARELNAKKGLPNLEGDIYRKIDGLLIDNAELLKKHYLGVTKNTAGYALGRVRGRDGSFDLSQLIAGSQGTLGLVTEITLRTQPWQPDTALAVFYFDSVEQAGQAVMKLRALGPSALEFVDHNLLSLLLAQNPRDLDGLVSTDPLPRMMLFCEFDEPSARVRLAKARKATEAVDKLASGHRVATDPIEQQALWKIRHSVATVLTATRSGKKSLPFVEDGIVPPDKLAEFIAGIYELMGRHKLDVALWGHAGDGSVHMRPHLDLSKKRDVDKLFALASDIADLVIGLGGSTSGEHGDGLIRAPYLRRLYGDEVYELFREVKRVFDPQNILNPGKKVDVTEADVRQRLRADYSMGHLFDHLPMG